MMWLYVVLVAVIVAAVVGTVWLKRAGDRAWQKHAGVVRVNLVLDTEAFEREMRKLTVATRTFSERCERVGRVMRESLERLDDYHQKGNE